MTRYDRLLEQYAAATTDAERLAASEAIYCHADLRLTEAEMDGDEDRAGIWRARAERWAPNTDYTAREMGLG